MKTYLAYRLILDSSLPWSNPPQVQIIYCGNHIAAALIAIRNEKIDSATIETWSNGDRIEKRQYWRNNDHYSVIDDPNF